MRGLRARGRDITSSTSCYSSCPTSTLASLLCANFPVGARGCRRDGPGSEERMDTADSVFAGIESTGTMCLEMSGSVVDVSRPVPPVRILTPGAGSPRACLIRPRAS